MGNYRALAWDYGHEWQKIPPVNPFTPFDKIHDFIDRLLDKNCNYCDSLLFPRIPPSYISWIIDAFKRRWGYEPEENGSGLKASSMRQ
ncbi:hypothetical protein OIU79_012942 [Salix purpurea]|uniref:Uncharacterized protein n=1 Tax=Salix purpurea TaxID=77065 RepID=A0A9Q0Q4G4_SALPP|nr:hypothetical protein OIU79_012942 [Salix purpurea]